MLNEDLVECLALSHDLGHTPFGHLGEEVLDELLADQGGFNHNRQSLRIVEHLEDRYPDFPGLNLTWEVREGIAKHSGRIDVHLAPEFAEYEPDLQPPIEAQLLDLVDEIAYNHHDVDDGLESGLIHIDDLAAEVPLFGEPLASARDEYSSATQRQQQTVALRRMIDRLVSDLISHSRSTLDSAGIGSVEDVRRHPAPLVGLSTALREGNAVLKSFLRERLYHHERIERMKADARVMLRALFERYLNDEALLPQDAQARAQSEGLMRVVADYIAGMTDRFASDEHQRLFS